MKTEEYILKLITDLVEKLYNQNIQLSLIINDCKRIAKMRGDYNNLLWLDLECHKLVEEKYQEFFFKDYKSKFNTDEFENHKKILFFKWLTERDIELSDEEKGRHSNEPVLLPLSVGEIEAELTASKEKRNNLSNTDGMHHEDKYYFEIAKTKLNSASINYEKGILKILSRIKNRVHEFLSNTELEILSGKKLSNYFDENKKLVDNYLFSLSPNFLEKIESLDNRLQENTEIANSQAMLTIRIILKEFADCIYPAAINEVQCSDGKFRILTEDKYISRIWQYIFENLKGSSIEIISEQLKDLGKKIDLTYEKSCKGVHSGVTSFEAYQCTILFYISIGDVIRITS